MTKKNRSDKQSEENPLEILAEHALYQYGLGNCVDLRDYAKSFDVLAKQAAEE